jgi:hypothetical protein
MLFRLKATSSKLYGIQLRNLNVDELRVRLINTCNRRGTGITPLSKNCQKPNKSRYPLARLFL